MRPFYSLITITTGAVVLIQLVLGSPVPWAKAYQIPSFDAVKLSNAADTEAAVDSIHARRTTAALPRAIPELEEIARRVPDADTEFVSVPDWDNMKRNEEKYKRSQQGPERIKNRDTQGNRLTCFIKRFFVALVDEKDYRVKQVGSVFGMFHLGSSQPARAINLMKRAVTGQVNARDTAQTGSTFKPFTLTASRPICATCVKRSPAELDEVSRRDSLASAKETETVWHRMARGFITVDKKSEGILDDSTVSEESTTWDDKLRKPRGHIAADKRSGSISDDSIIETQDGTSWDNRIRKPRGHIAADRSKDDVSGNFDVTEDMQRANKDKRISSAVSSLDLEIDGRRARSRGFITVDKGPKAGPLSSRVYNIMGKKKKKQRGVFNGAEKRNLVKGGNVDVQTLESASKYPDKATMVEYIRATMVERRDMEARDEKE